ncbi:MAG: hypothetical protein HN348_20170 [Proteobacteria bacterium]|jgi:carbon monoxide dehydrogenase subunit G|nr:hypothetical protein [Pseudomonadota bacterium]
MLVVNGDIHAQCTLEKAWALFTQFEEVARLIPTVEEVEIKDGRVHARVVITLGVLPVSSRLVLEVTEQTVNSSIRAEGLSYLGETIVDQIAKKAIRDIDAGSVGRLNLQLDLKEHEESGISVEYQAEVDAEGRLKRIYQSIMKSKAPAMMAEFAENLLERLEAPEEEAPPKAVDTDALSQESEAQTEEPSTEVPDGELAKQGWWASFLAWLKGLFGSSEAS